MEFEPVQYTSTIMHTNRHTEYTIFVKKHNSSYFFCPGPVRVRSLVPTSQQATQQQQVSLTLDLYKLSTLI